MITNISEIGNKTKSTIVSVLYTTESKILIKSRNSGSKEYRGLLKTVLHSFARNESSQSERFINESITGFWLVNYISYDWEIATWAGINYVSNLWANNTQIK